MKTNLRRHLRSSILFVILGASAIVDPSLLLQVAIVAAAISLVVGIHEFAHLISARMLGIVVLRYAIGFGPRSSHDVDSASPGSFVCYRSVGSLSCSVSMPMPAPGRSPARHSSEGAR